MFNKPSIVTFIDILKTAQVLELALSGVADVTIDAIGMLVNNSKILKHF